MLNLKGESIYLRALEAEDLDFLFLTENDMSIWEISGTTTPYSKHVLQLYLNNAHKDIYEVKQLRLCICTNDHSQIGFIDLFDFDPSNLRAGMGIVITDKSERNKGVATQAIELLCTYAFSVLGLRQLYANVLEDNLSSVHVFRKMGFDEVGVKKDWIRSVAGFKNEILFQKLNKSCT